MCTVKNGAARLTAKFQLARKALSRLKSALFQGAFSCSSQCAASGPSVIGGSWIRRAVYTE